MKSVNEVCRLSGVSRRTLRYYDEIGLLPPSEVRESGYRYYNDESLYRLWRILFYKELDLSLEEIRRLLDSSEDEEKKLLRRHQQKLQDKQVRLQKMSSSIDSIIENRFEVSMLRDFDQARVKDAEKRHESEIRENMQMDDRFHRFFYPLAKSGIIDTASITGKAAVLMGIDWDEFIRLGSEISTMFLEAMPEGAESAKAKAAVAAFAEFVDMLGPCNAEGFCRIGRAYLHETEMPDKIFPKLGIFVGESLLSVYA